MNPTRALPLAVFCIFQGGYLLIASGRARTIDEHSIHFMAESLWRTGSMAVPQMVASGNFYGRVGRDGRPYAPYGPGQPLLAAPYYAAVGGALEKAAPKGRSLLAREAATSLVSTTAAAACIAVFTALAAFAGAGPRAALVASAVLGGATVLAVYAKQAFTEPLLALLGAAALLALGRGLESARPSTFALASAFAGYAFLTKFAAGALLLAALVGGYLFQRRRAASPRELLALAAPFAAAVLLHLVLNLARFGDPLEFGYPPEAERGKALNTFHTPLWLGLYGLLLSPGKGLALFAPPAVLGLFGFAELARRRPGLAVAAGTYAATTLVFYALYTQWEGGYCFGPRYLVPILPALLLPLATLGERPRRRVALALAGLVLVGVAVQAVGAGTSYLEDQAGTGRYYDDRYDYRLGYTLAGQAALLETYGIAALSGAGFGERLGLGLDFWFVLLHKAGFGTKALVVWGGVAAAFVLTGVALLKRRTWPAANAAPPKHSARGLRQ